MAGLAKLETMVGQYDVAETRHWYQKTRVTPLVSLIRGIAAGLASGMVLATVVLIVVQLVPSTDWTTHGGQMVVADAVSAAVSVLMVHRADRSRSLGAALWSVGALVIIAIVLWWMWWS